MGVHVKSNGGDVISFLKAQHKEIKALFEDVVAERGPERAAKFRRLCSLLARHEAGEEGVVHPVATRALDGGEAMVAARLSEETAAKKAIGDLKGLDPSSNEFDMQIRALQAKVLMHAEREEREELRKLAASLDQERLMRMRKTVERTEALADDSDDTDPNVYERTTMPANGRDVPGKA
jgi:hypothetical protein